METYKLIVYSNKNKNVVDEILNEHKIHYIVASNKNISIDSIIDIIDNQINKNLRTLSIVVNDGKEEYIIKQYNHIKYQKLQISMSKHKNEINMIIDGKRMESSFIETLAKNNGMTIDEFKDSYFHDGRDVKILNCLIIQTTDFMYK